MTTHWFGPLLRRIRTEAGMSLRQLEAKSGIPGVVVGSYERGDRQPTVARADKVLGALGKRLAVVDADDRCSCEYTCRVILADGSETIRPQRFADLGLAEGARDVLLGADADQCSPVVKVEILRREVGPWVAVDGPVAS